MPVTKELSGVLPGELSPTKRFTRRQFLRRSAVGATAAAAGTLLYTWRVEPHWVEVVRRPLPIAGLPQSLVAKRLVQLSDLHAGRIVDQNYLIAAVERVAELAPDAIVITGDFMSCYGDEEVPRAMEVIRALPPAPLGRLAVLGNHDYGARWRQYRVADKLAAAMERSEVRVLRNEVADMAGLQVAGVDDFWTNRFDAEKALGELSSATPAVALCHNPDAVDLPSWRDYRGWILAGHTHGGQCKPPWLPPPLTPVSNKRYVAGPYGLAAGRNLYINRGLGYLRRVRFNARPEITLFTLEQA